MPPRRTPERRAQPRFPILWRMESKELFVSGVAQPLSEGTPSSQIRDISPSGMCVLTEQAFQKDQILLCKIFPSKFPVAIPTLAQVRWTLKESKNHGFRVGIRFLL